MIDKMKDVPKDIHKRHLERQQQRRREMKRRRVIFFTTLIILFVLIVVYFTPLFNIRKVTVSGNSKIEDEQIIKTIGEIDSENLFRVNTKKIKKDIKTIAYIDKVSFDKKILPPTLKVKVVECKPVAYFIFNESSVVVDKKLKVLEVSEAGAKGLPVVEGLNLTNSTLGYTADVDDKEKSKELIKCLEVISKEGLENSINNISVEDVNNITFTYENRLDIVCGSTLDFDVKIKMLKKALNSKTLAENSKGEIDLSITGKAIYSP